MFLSFCVNDNGSLVDRDYDRPVVRCVSHILAVKCHYQHIVLSRRGIATDSLFMLSGHSFSLSLEWN